MLPAELLSMLFAELLMMLPAEPGERGRLATPRPGASFRQTSSAARISSTTNRFSWRLPTAAQMSSTNGSTGSSTKAVPLTGLQSFGAAPHRAITCPIPWRRSFRTMA